jgi:aspartate aminotransferase-like enzyme
VVISYAIEVAHPGNKRQTTDNCINGIFGERMGPLKGLIWRIGLMGSGSTRENVLLVLDSLHRALNVDGFSCASRIEAAQAAYQ